jgi:hypothetical protein
MDFINVNKQKSKITARFIEYNYNKLFKHILSKTTRRKVSKTEGDNWENKSEREEKETKWERWNDKAGRKGITEQAQKNKCKTMEGFGRQENDISSIYILFFEVIGLNGSLLDRNMK